MFEMLNNELLNASRACSCNFQQTFLLCSIPILRRWQKRKKIANIKSPVTAISWIWTQEEHGCDATYIWMCSVAVNVSVVRRFFHTSASLVLFFIKIIFGAMKALQSVRCRIQLNVKLMRNQREWTLIRYMVCLLVDFASHSKWFEIRASFATIALCQTNPLIEFNCHSSRRFCFFLNIFFNSIMSN